MTRNLYPRALDTFLRISIVLAIFIRTNATQEFNDTLSERLNILRLGTSLDETEYFFSPLHLAHLNFSKRYQTPENEAIIGKRSIFFVGDSTFRNQFQAFCLAMGAEWKNANWVRGSTSPLQNVTFTAKSSQPCGLRSDLRPNEPYESRCVGRWGNYQVQALHILAITMGSSVSRAVSEAPAP